MTTDAPAGNLSKAQSVALTVSDAMTTLYEEQFGRRPTSVRTNFAGPDVLVTTLQDSLVRVERALLEMGDDHGRDTRRPLQYATQARLRETVQRITGRKVVSFAGGIDTAGDVSSEVFYLEPKGETAASDVPRRSAVSPAGEWVRASREAGWFGTRRGPGLVLR